MNVVRADSLCPKEAAMYGGILFVTAMMVVALSPVIWVAWWLIADLGQRVNGTFPATHYDIGERRFPRAA